MFSSKTANLDVNNNDYCKIMAAIHADNTGAALQKLLANDSFLDINTCGGLDDGTPLFELIKMPGKIAQLDILINNGADINAKTPNENLYSPLYCVIAAYNDDSIDYCKILLDSGANTDDIGFVLGTFVSAEKAIKIFHGEFVPGKGIVMSDSGLLLQAVFSHKVTPSLTLS